eukprot:Skav229802  [mRNA]  locus=scaffold567:226852:249871:- [translate_table: standard]
MIRCSEFGAEMLEVGGFGGRWKCFWMFAGSEVPGQKRAACCRGTLRPTLRSSTQAAEVSTTLEHKDAICDLTWSPSGRLTAATADGTVSLWEDCAQAQYNASVESGSSLGETDKDHKSSHESGLSPEKLSLGETLEDIMESSLLSRVAWTKILDEDGGRSYFEIFLRQLDDEQEDLTTELIESTLHQMLQVAFAFFAGSLSMCIMGSCGSYALDRSAYYTTASWWLAIVNLRLKGIKGVQGTSMQNRKANAGDATAADLRCVGTMPDSPAAGCAAFSVPQAMVHMAEQKRCEQREIREEEEGEEEEEEEEKEEEEEGEDEEEEEGEEGEIAPMMSD